MAEYLIAIIDRARSARASTSAEVRQYHALRAAARLTEAEPTHPQYAAAARLVAALADWASTTSDKKRSPKALALREAIAAAEAAV